MAHRQSYREGPAHSTIATPSTTTPIIDCNEDYTYQDNRDTQQIADDSIAFLRTFSLRLQRFRAQVGEFAHVDQPDDIETSDNGPIKVTNTTADDTRSNGSSSPLANKQGDPPVKQLTHAPRLCEQCESSRAELMDIPPQSPTTETNQTPPCPTIPFQKAPGSHSEYVTYRHPFGELTLPNTSISDGPMQQSDRSETAPTRVTHRSWPKTVATNPTAT